ncbi:hypothetical protein SFC43_35725 [Bacteroides sp. CR5/BHMF/2]|nr:hypothetical protein [Bacteroides sp. CR5/BHMF/2]
MDVGGADSGVKTPTEFYQSEKRKPSIVLNGGYFANGKTVSLICKNGKILSDNISVVNRLLEGKRLHITLPVQFSVFIQMGHIMLTGYINRLNKPMRMICRP